jgi:DNA-binding NarL/FixJ family response regulator
MPEAIRVLVAEDHPFFRSGLRLALSGQPSITLVAEAADGATALERIRSLRPTIAILDIGLPEMNGFAVARRIYEEHLPVEVIFLTIHDDEESFDEALALGVKGYLLKDCTDAEIVRCVHAVAAGQHYTNPALTSHLVRKTQRVEHFVRQHPGLELLTRQERLVLTLIAQDLTTKEIARQLAVATRTVDAHRANICKKLDLHGQHALTRFAARHRADL